MILSPHWAVKTNCMGIYWNKIVIFTFQHMRLYKFDAYGWIKWVEFDVQSDIKVITQGSRVGGGVTLNPYLAQSNVIVRVWTVSWMLDYFFLFSLKPPLCTFRPPSSSHPRVASGFVIYNITCCNWKLTKLYRFIFPYIQYLSFFLCETFSVFIP